MAEEIKYPKVIAGAVVFNEKNEILMLKSPFWNNKYTLPGGKINLGESITDSLKREVKEETNLDIMDDIELIDITDGLDLADKNNKDYEHLIFLDYKTISKGGKIKLDNREATDFKWLSLDEWLKKDENKFAPYILPVLRKLKEKEGDSLEGRYKRALADYQNLLKRTAEEKIEFTRYANEGMIMDFLPVYENLKLAINHSNGHEEDNSWLQGIKYVIKQFQDALKNYNVEEIKTVGEKFDHNLMEALEKEETDNEAHDGLVARELSPGYLMNEKVIKAARVIVYEKKGEL